MFKRLAAIFLILALIPIIIIYLWTNHSAANTASQPKKFDYTVVFVGDSMTEYLGNFDYLEPDLKEYYLQKNFLLLNYGYSSTNVLSLPDRIEKDSTHSGRIFQAIDKIPYNVIIIESMGNNPLSEYPLDQGLKVQTQTLDTVVSRLRSQNPNAKIVFMATIAPSKSSYGEGAVNLTPTQRAQWVSDRVAYIQNHIAYAKSHDIPLINVYADSLNSSGDVNESLLNPADHIHPSPTGVRFISQEIAAFIFNNQLVH